ncbi:hypothetical protein C1T71_17805 [Salmonella enterica]|nr:hypothetical protein [Salmonella enterica]
MVQTPTDVTVPDKTSHHFGIGNGSICNFAFFSGLIGAQFWAERAQPKSPELDAKLLVSC